MDISSQLLIDENNAKNLALSANPQQDSNTTATTVVSETQQQLLDISEPTSGAAQLIDFGGDSLPHEHMNHNANILNNNNTTTTTGAASQLVTGWSY